jgi:hypothetical protein
MADERLFLGSHCDEKEGQQRPGPVKGDEHFCIKDSIDFVPGFRDVVLRCAWDRVGRSFAVLFVACALRSALFS